jgi:hypothetical protein
VLAPMGRSESTRVPNLARIEVRVCQCRVASDCRLKCCGRECAETEGGHTVAIATHSLKTISAASKYLRQM